MMTECLAYDEWKLNESDGRIVTVAWPNFARFWCPGGSRRAFAGG
jgi:hypothetical protein